MSAAGRDMAADRNLDVGRARDEPGELATLGDRRPVVVRVLEHERRHRDCRQDVSHVDLEVHLGVDELVAGAERVPEHVRQGAKLLVPSRSASCRAPLSTQLPRIALTRDASFGDLTHGVLHLTWSLFPFGTPAAGDQRPRPVWVGSREQQAETNRPPTSRRSRRAPSPTASMTARTSSMRVFERRELVVDAVGEPAPALVEEDQARERREPLEEVRHRRLLHISSTFETQPGT